jgi:HEAT repeat protein
MTRMTFALGTVACLVLLCSGSKGPAAPPAADDEQVLHAAGLGADGPSLIAFFQARSRPVADGDTLDRLVQQFAAAAREEQAKAAAGLVGLGPLALPALRQAANDLDRPDLAARAARCLPWLDGSDSVKLVIAAVRTLAVQKPDGAAAALLGYLPFADSTELLQEIQGALAAVAAPGGKADKALLRGLGDGAGLRRAAAGVALCRASPPQPVPAVRNLLKDPTPAVRLRTALALAESGDAEAVPVLIDLLAELSAEERRPVEEVLRRLLGEWAPTLEFARDDKVSRGARRDAWASVWRRTDGALLLETLGEHSLTTDKRDRVRRLIAQLGGEEFAVREKAGQELAALGRIALPQLREAARDRDAEVARRAAGLIERLEREPGQQVPSALFRLLAIRQPAGAVEALLAYLPNAEEEGRSEEAQEALGRLALREGKVDPALRQGLSDARPLVRAAASRALVEGGGADGRAAARKLLDDEAPLARLHVALALARAKEREAVPVLIDLLAVLPAEQVGQVEDTLYALAGETPPEGGAGDKPADRKKCRDAWFAWWKANGDRVDLARLADPPALGLTLVCESNKCNRVFEIDRHGKERWAIENAGGPVDAVVLPGQGVLIAEWNENRVTERDFQGKIVWERKVDGSPCNVQRLANGNTLIAVQGGPILEVDRAGKEVFRIANVPGGVWAARRSRRGDVVCLTKDDQCLWLDTTGKPRTTFATDNTFNAVGCVDLLANDHVLIACFKAGKVIELDRAGKKVFEWNVPGVMTASALPNGHILAACGDDAQRVCEVDRAGKIVWECKTAGQPFRARRR